MTQKIAIARAKEIALFLAIFFWILYDHDARFADIINQSQWGPYTKSRLLANARIFKKRRINSVVPHGADIFYAYMPDFNWEGKQDHPALLEELQVANVMGRMLSTFVKTGIPNRELMKCCDVVNTTLPYLKIETNGTNIFNGSFIHPRVEALWKNFTEQYKEINFTPGSILRVLIKRMENSLLSF